MTEDTLSMISDVRLDASEIIVEFTVSINSTEVAVVLNLIIHLIDKRINPALPIIHALPITIIRLTVYNISW